MRKALSTRHPVIRYAAAVAPAACLSAAGMTAPVGRRQWGVGCVRRRRGCHALLAARPD